MVCRGGLAPTGSRCRRMSFGRSSELEFTGAALGYAACKAGLSLHIRHGVAPWRKSNCAGPGVEEVPEPAPVPRGRSMPAVGAR